MMRFVLRTLFVATAALSASGVRASEQAGDVRHGLSVSTGAMSYSQSGVTTQSGTAAGSMGVEWAYFTKRDLAAFTFYRLARDAERARLLYQAGGAGFRFFPMTLGTPIKSFRSLSVVDYDFAFKPYVESSLSVGRYLIDTVFALDAADYSSEFYGLNFGGGVVWSVFDAVSFDFRVNAEIAQGFGALDFSATTIFITLGLLRYI